MFGDDSCLDALQYGQSEGDAPEYSSRSLHCSNVPVGVDQDILQHAYGETNQEETVSDDVVVVPEGEVALLEPAHFRTRSLKTPQEEGGSQVPEAVRGDEDAQQCVDDVDGGGGRLRDAGEDERDEEDVGEGGVDASVQGNPPLLAEPGRVVDTCPVGRPAIGQELVPLNSFI